MNTTKAYAGVLATVILAGCATTNPHVRPIGTCTPIGPDGETCLDVEPHRGLIVRPVAPDNHRDSSRTAVCSNPYPR
jgi:hypothetical protein